MGTQPILLVIGVAIAANLVIMGALVVTLLARRNGRLAMPDGLVEAPAYRLAAATAVPTAVSAATYARPAGEGVEDLSKPATEEFDATMTATDLTDIRRFRPVMHDEGERAETTIASFLSGGPTEAEEAGATTRDDLTGLDGPLTWDIRIRDEEARLARYRRPVAVVLVDLDGLDRLTALVGEDAAERIVPPVGQTLRRQSRVTDHVARMGASRFAVLMPETDEIQAINYVERVRAECDRWLAAGAVATRLAIGWASPAPGSDLRTAVRVAGDRLNADRRRMDATSHLGASPGAAPAADSESIDLSSPSGPEAVG